jgi:hypothetical protein
MTRIGSFWVGPDLLYPGSCDISLRQGSRTPQALILSKQLVEARREEIYLGGDLAISFSRSYLFLSLVPQN